METITVELDHETARVLDDHEDGDQLVNRLLRDYRHHHDESDEKPEGQAHPSV